MSGETESDPEKDGQQMHVAVSHTNAAPAGLTKLEQFQLMMNEYRAKCHRRKQSGIGTGCI